MKNHGVLGIVGLVTALLISPVAMADGDVAAGKEKSTVCGSCHGVKGESVAPNYPVLAGQHQNYLEQALKAYRSGERANPIMAAFVTALSDEDIADLAAYFASQKGLFTLSR